MLNFDIQNYIGGLYKSAKCSDCTLIIESSDFAPGMIEKLEQTNKK